MRFLGGNPISFFGRRRPRDQRSHAQRPHRRVIRVGMLLCCATLYWPKHKQSVLASKKKIGDSRVDERCRVTPFHLGIGTPIADDTLHPNIAPVATVRPSTFQIVCSLHPFAVVLQCNVGHIKARHCRVDWGGRWISGMDLMSGG